MELSKVITLVCAATAVALVTGVVVGIVIGARHQQAPAPVLDAAPPPSEHECAGVCALGALPRDRVVVVRPRARPKQTERPGPLAGTGPYRGQAPT